MKKLFFLFIVISLLFSACSNNNKNSGELLGVRKTKMRFWTEPKTHGMVKIPRGSFTMGMNDEDLMDSWNTTTRTVSLEPFWIDETEITNNEYKEFVQYVKEEKARKILGEQFDEFLILEDENGNPLDPPEINWDTEIEWDNPEVIDALEEMYYPPHERFDGKRTIDTRKLIYEWTWIDLYQAAHTKYNYETGEYEGMIVDAQGNLRPVDDRSAFIMRKSIHIYPDTLVWIRDFTYAFNEPLARLYFSHPGFDEYPVVGVNWDQAQAFCNWRTKKHNNALSGKKNYQVQEYRLPTESEWEWAARGGNEQGLYPWGGPYTRSSKGCIMANFKPTRGNYASDGFTLTSPVGEYKSNDFGLFDMAGNVSEWTSSAYDESSYDFVHDLNPNYQYNASNNEPRVMKRKVIRGGSWKDVKYYLQVGARTYEYEDETKSYIGFRCVRSYIGKDND